LERALEDNPYGKNSYEELLRLLVQKKQWPQARLVLKRAKHFLVRVNPLSDCWNPESTEKTSRPPDAAAKCEIPCRSSLGDLCPSSKRSPETLNLTENQ
jgi:hypothetical protein